MTFNDPVPERRNLLALTLLIHAWYILGADPVTTEGAVRVLWGQVELERPEFIRYFLWAIYGWYFWQWYSLDKCFWVIDGKGIALSFDDELNLLFKNPHLNCAATKLSALEGDIRSTLHTLAHKAEDSQYRDSVKIEKFVGFTKLSNGTFEATFHNPDSSSKPIAPSYLDKALDYFHGNDLSPNVKITSVKAKSVFIATIAQYIPAQDARNQGAYFEAEIRGDDASAIYSAYFRKTFLKGKYTSRIVFPTLIALTAPLAPFIPNWIGL